ncbi:MAG: BNR-4 repeat-containing protein [Planctomycetes bacterium]|nr:BNR-4 repeat-containing protein [Planctomycetota bacterium]
MPSAARPFAEHGCEKMIYDARMGPVAVADGDRIVIVYQAAEEGLPGHPHIVAYDRRAERWSKPIRLGTAAGLDHHFAPILWLDGAGHWHVLFDCHFSPGTHLVSQRPHDVADWTPAEPIAASITYPSQWRLADGRHLLVYRVEGHLGYWIYRLSDDGGRTWGPERPLLDFDRRPRDEVDRWAGSYLLPALDRRGCGVHLGFCYWDERDGCHPRYRFKRDLLTRYHLYYLRLDPDSGRLTTIDGRPLDAPVNRGEAEAAKVLDTGDELTNLPTVAADQDDRPVLLAPVSDGDPWRCRFHFLRWDGSTWRTSTITETDNTWNASRIVRLEGNEVAADLIVGAGKGEECFYGGGELQRWVSRDGGASWRLQQSFVPRAGLLYNNPRPVELADGGTLDDAFVFYGWNGPGGVWAVPGCATENRNRGRAWLWLDGRWV